MLQIPDTAEVDVRYDVDNTAIFGCQKFKCLFVDSHFFIFKGFFEEKLVRNGSKIIDKMPGGGRGVMFDVYTLVYTLKFSLY